LVSTAISSCCRRGSGRRGPCYCCKNEKLTTLKEYRLRQSHPSLVVVPRKLKTPSARCNSAYLTPVFSRILTFGSWAPGFPVLQGTIRSQSLCCLFRPPSGDLS
ncbi:unnamed protein product, partial [Scytosiphon promiscuus]